MVIKCPCILLFWTLLFTFANTYFFPHKDLQAVCDFKGYVHTSFDSKCAANATITLLFPTEFWKLLGHQTAIFEVWTTQHQQWNISCLQTSLKKCETEVQVRHPVTNGLLEIMVLLSPGGFPCSVLELHSYERCFPTEPLTTSPAVLTGDGGSYPNEQLEYGLSIVGIVVCCAILVWIVRTRLRHRRNAKEVMSDLRVVLLELSEEDSMNSGNESYPLSKASSLTMEMFKAQLDNFCQLTVVNSDNAENLYRNVSDVQNLLRSNDAFIIVPDTRMAPIEEELSAPDGQVAIRMLYLLSDRGNNCAFVRFSNNNSVHLILREKYIHLSSVPVFTFSDLPKKYCQTRDTVTKLLQHLNKHSRDTNTIMI